MASPPLRRGSSGLCDVFSVVESVHDKSQKVTRDAGVRQSCMSLADDKGVSFALTGCAGHCATYRVVVVFQAWRSMITQVITRPCLLYTSLRHPFWIACGSLSGCARQDSTSAENPSTSYLWIECEYFRTLSHLSPLMSFPCRDPPLVCARQAPSRRPPPQLMASLRFNRGLNGLWLREKDEFSDPSGPICFIMAGVVSRVPSMDKHTVDVPFVIGPWQVSTC